MKFHQILSFVAFLTMITSGQGHIGGGSPYQNVNPQVYCGRSLARALALLCFDEDGYEKRSDVGPTYGSVMPPYYKEQEMQLAFPWSAPSKARGMSFPSRGKRYQGVVNECCNKPCSVNELLSYC
ncbi:bombyxin A-3 homolog [Battus philenor]|uniref:bombyxin A-3 homolog n=1 Tax=Battus philenor TaxID=42288 RepID=UPI0035D0FF02